MASQLSGPSNATCQAKYACPPGNVSTIRIGLPVPTKHNVCQDLQVVAIRISSDIYVLTDANKGDGRKKLSRIHNTSSTECVMRYTVHCTT